MRKAGLAGLLKLMFNSCHIPAACACPTGCFHNIAGRMLHLVLGLKFLTKTLSGGPAERRCTSMERPFSGGLGVFLQIGTRTCGCRPKRPPLWAERKRICLASMCKEFALGVGRQFASRP